MKRPSPRLLEPATAPKKIASAKSNKPFMAALLDRDHRGHKDAVEQWTRLHQAAFPEPESSAPDRSTRLGGKDRATARGLTFRGSGRTENLGSGRVVGRKARPFKTRLQGADSAVQGRSSVAGSTDRPVINMEADRIQALLDDAPARFEIEDSPDADPDYGSWRANHTAGANAVSRHASTIEQEASRQGVESDWVKAIMYVENAHGYYGVPLEPLGLADSIFPMNISPDPWSALNDPPADLTDPEANIRIAVTLIGRISERIDDPTLEKVASVWNFTGRETVSDFGARVRDVYENRRWEDPVIRRGQMRRARPN